MIERIIDWCAGNRFLVFTGTLVLTLWGIWAMTATPLDAVPDISDVQVIVSTEWMGRSPDLIEDQITYPIVTALISTPRVKAVRGFTDFGISYVYVIFEDGTDIYWARSRVVEYLQGIRGKLPEGVNPVIGPDATGVGWVFEYALVDETGRHNLAELRGFQDWYLRYWLASIPGVAEVASIGGFVKQYQVNLDPNKLAAYDMSVKDVVDAIKASNNDVEGRVLEFAGREYMVRGRGYLKSTSDIEKISLGADPRGTPIRVGDVAQVRLGPDIRRGVAELDGKGEVVGGIIVMRFGENALEVIDRVKAKLREVQGAMPAGVKIVPTYDRSWLIGESIDTLRRTLIEEAIVVSLVIILFLFHFRSALVPILALPIAVVASFIPMYYLDVSSNIMSLGGIALAIGVLVDASIVMVENAYRHVSEPEHAAEAVGEGEPHGHGSVPYEEQPRVIIRAAKQVGRPIFFSLAIIIVSFVPVFLLEAQEGRMFRPLAFTKTSVMIFASLLSIMLVPVLMTIFIRGKRLKPESQNPVSRFFTWLYDPIIRLALRWKWTALLINFAVVPLTIPLAVPDRQRVHAAALRGVDALHADVAAGAVDHRGDASAPGAGQDPPPVPGGRTGVRDGRTRHHVHGQHADGDGEHYHHAQAAGAVAPRHDDGASAGRHGRGHAVPGLPQRLDAAHSQPAGHAADRHQDHRRDQDLRRRSGGHPASRRADREDSEGPPGHPQRVCRTRRPGVLH